MPYRCDAIDPKTTAVIVVDMQNDFVAPGAPLLSQMAQDLVPRLAETLDTCRERGMRVVFTSHAHRSDGSDMGLYDDLYPPIAERKALIDGTQGVAIYPPLAPKDGEHVIKKPRYSVFFGTTLDIMLREWGIKTVIVAGTTTENCCHATARDAMFHNYRVVFLSDGTGTFDYPDMGFGAMPAQEVHQATLRILAFSTAHVMSCDEMLERSNTAVPA